MMCQEVMELMQRYIDGDLNEQETLLMMDHVGQCPDCAAMLLRLQRLSSELEQLPRVVPRFSLVDAILPELERLNRSEINEVPAAETEKDETATSRVSRSGRPGRDLFRRLSSVAALGVVVGLLLFTRPDQWPFSSGNSQDEAGPSLNESAADSAGTFSLNAPASKDKDGDGTEEKSGGVMSGSAVPKGDVAPNLQVRPTTKETRDAIVPNPTATDDNTPPATPDMSISDGDHAEKGIVPPIEAVPGSPGIMADNGSMSIGAVDPTVSFISPDGKWRAVSTEGTGIIQVYNTEDDSLLFESEPREGSIGDLTWNPESTYLNYTWTDLEGNATHLMFDVANVKESVAIVDEPENQQPTR